MSISITSKLKFPDNIIKGNDKKISIANFDSSKENLNLLKQMQNLKLNKYAKFLKESKKSSNIPTGRNKKSRNDEEKLLIENATNQILSSKSKGCLQANEEESTGIAESSSHSLTKSGKNAKETPKDINMISDIYNLEIILEQETQRTETVSHTNKKSNLSDSLINEREENENAEKIQIDSMRDSSQEENPQYIADYMLDIYNNLLEEETNLKSLSGYMKKQSDINEKMRAILIDWIIDVHYKFKLTPETLFLSVNLIDRYLEANLVDRDQLQLIGVVSLLIACKYEEIFSPELRDFEYITDKAYKKEEMTKLEIEMLKLFSFEITFPSSFRFFEILSAKLKFSKKDNSLGRYLLELFLLDYRQTKFTSSVIANAVCFLVINLKGKENSFTSLKECRRLNQFFEFNKKVLKGSLNKDKSKDVNDFWYERMKECCKDICFILENIDNTGLLSVKRKFMSPDFDRIAKFTTQVVNC